MSNSMHGDLTHAKTLRREGLGFCREGDFHQGFHRLEQAATHQRQYLRYIKENNQTTHKAKRYESIQHNVCGFCVSDANEEEEGDARVISIDVSRGELGKTLKHIGATCLDLGDGTPALEALTEAKEIFTSLVETNQSNINNNNTNINNTTLCCSSCLQLQQRYLVEILQMLAHLTDVDEAMVYLDMTLSILQERQAQLQGPNGTMENCENTHNCKNNNNNSLHLGVQSEEQEQNTILFIQTYQRMAEINMLTFPGPPEAMRMLDLAIRIAQENLATNVPRMCVALAGLAETVLSLGVPDGAAVALGLYKPIEKLQQEMLMKRHVAGRNVSDDPLLFELTITKKSLALLYEGLEQSNDALFYFEAVLMLQLQQTQFQIVHHANILGTALQEDNQLDPISTISDGGLLSDPPLDLDLAHSSLSCARHSTVAICNIPPSCLAERRTLQERATRYLEFAVVVVQKLSPTNTCSSSVTSSPAALRDANEWCRCVDVLVAAAALVLEPTLVVEQKDDVTHSEKALRWYKESLSLARYTIRVVPDMECGEEDEQNEQERMERMRLLTNVRTAHDHIVLEIANVEQALQVERAESKPMNHEPHEPQTGSSTGTGTTGAIGPGSGIALSAVLLAVALGFYSFFRRRK